MVQQEPLGDTALCDNSALNPKRGLLCARLILLTLACFSQQNAGIWIVVISPSLEIGKFCPMTTNSWSTSRTVLVLERGCIALAVGCIYLGYFWINEWLVANQIKAYNPSIWIDRWVPFSAPWIYIYALVLITAFWPILVVRHRPLFYRTALAYLVVQSSSWICFLLVPVKTIHRPVQLTENSFIHWGIQLGYWLDLPYCCFPSLHVGMAVMAALACWKVDRMMGYIALVVAGLIGASTLFVKQHYFVDVVGGFALAYLAYRWLLYPVPVSHLSPSELQFPRRYSLVLVMWYGFGISCAYVAYQQGWQPWVR